MIFDAARTATGVVRRRPERHKANLRGGHIAETPAPDRQVMATNAPSAVRATHEVQADNLRHAGLAAVVDVVDVIDRRAAPARPHTEPATIEADDGIYDSRDLDVTPPAELAPYRPIVIMRPGSSPETVTFELVIDTKGLVQSVELLQPVRRWDDVMLVSVMKARRFRPATRNNHPVRYRTRILVGASPDQ
jgi:hypothetical protein